jgi:hypothetical protein
MQIVLSTIVGSTAPRRTEAEVLARIFGLVGLCRAADDPTPLPEPPDIAAIEEFVVRCFCR